jgi:hypothetical protein
MPDHETPDEGSWENRPFRAPVPPGPPFPPGAPFPPGPLGAPGPPDRNFYFVAETDSGPGREHEDIMLRRVPGTVAHRFRGAAGARGFTHAQYLSALVSLHEAMRRRADEGDAEVAAVLDQLGLGTVSI